MATHYESNGSAFRKSGQFFHNSVVSEALAHPGGIISNLSESAIYHHPNEHNNNTDDMQGLTTNYVASALVNYLKEYNDPRLPILVRRNGFGDGNNNTTNDEMFDLLKEHYPNYETDFSQWTDRYVGMAANPDSTNSLWSTNAYFTIPYTDDEG